MKVVLGSADPRRFSAIYDDVERRWEQIFDNARRISLDFIANKKSTEASLSAVQAVLDARPNSTNTSQNNDRIIQLAGSRGIRGMREHVVTSSEDAFLEWRMGVTFATPFLTPPIVLLTPESFDSTPATVVLEHVTPAGFEVKISFAAAQMKMRFYFQAWGDE